MDALGGELLYLGLIGVTIGVLCLIHPVRRLAIPTRKTALLVLLAGFSAFAAGAFLPVQEVHVDVYRTHLDDFAPEFQFDEFHSAFINAPKDRIYAALHQVKPSEIRYFAALWRARFWHAPVNRPILDWFSRFFLTLADGPDEIVFGRAGHPDRLLEAGQFATDHRAPLIRIVMNFHVTEIDPARCLLSTETRVYTQGFHTTHGFAAYWRMIRPGSGIIRRAWLRAIKLRAEGAVTKTAPSRGQKTT